MHHNLLNFIKRFFFTPNDNPRGPSYFEMVQNLRNQSFLEFLYDHSISLIKKYGTIVKLPKNQYLIADPKAFKYILKTHVSNFSKKNSIYERLKLFFGSGIIVEEGQRWQKNRELIHPIFDRDKLKSYSEIMVKSTLELVEQWEENLPNFIDIGAVIGGLSLKIAFRSFANYEASNKDIKTIIYLFKIGNSHISLFPFLKPWIPTPKNLLFFSYLNKTRKILYKVIHNRKASNAHYGDLIDILLNAHNAHEPFLSEEEVLHHTKTLIITGYETIANAITWALYLLSQNPNYREQMEHEIDTLLNGRPPTLEDCQQLPVTKAIFLETLRLYPSIWLLPRTAIQEDFIEGYKIPAKSQLLLNISALHKDPKYWERPYEFYPPHFLQDNKRDPFCYLPFSIGPHACIGSAFATMEGILVLATLAQKYRIECLNTKKAMKPAPFITLRPSTTLKMHLIPRSYKHVHSE